jgi:segregation and condensation protein B
LVERRLIKVVGRKETIGRPLLYGTSGEFLRHFGLKHLSELPDINSFVAQQPPPTGEIQEELIPEESFSEETAETPAEAEQPQEAEAQ